MNPRAVAFQSNGTTKAGTGKPGFSAGNTQTNIPAVMSAPAPLGAAAPCSEEFLGELFRQVFGNNTSNLNQNAANQNAAKGGQSRYNGVLLNTKCSNCRNAKALFCNHCQICHQVDHRNSNCPKRSDPNWKPLN